MKRWITLALALIAANGPDYSVRFEPRQFSSCNDAATFALFHPYVGRYEYQLSGSLVKGTITRLSSGGYRGTGSVRYFFEPRRSVLVLPRWTWPQRTAAQTAGYNRFIDALRAHELGHRAIAQDAIRSRGGEISIIVPTLAQAKRAMHDALHGQLRDVSAEIAARQAVYDRVTDHGTHQSDGPQYGFAGGANVVFTCR